MKRALFRCDVYRILALGFDLPSEKNRQEMLQILEDLAEVKRVQKIFRKMLLEVKGAKAEDLEKEHPLLFTTKVLCPPSEGSYHLAERGPVLGDVTAFYKAFGLNFLAGEGPPDGIKMELAFLSTLALKEAYALENKMLKEAQITHEAQKKFLRDHLGRWGLVFAQRLKQNASSEFYQTLADFLHKWLDLEKGYFKVDPPPLPAYLPSLEEEPVRCAV